MCDVVATIDEAAFHCWLGAAHGDWHHAVYGSGGHS